MRSAQQWHSHFVVLKLYRFSMSWMHAAIELARQIQLARCTDPWICNATRWAAISIVMGSGSKRRQRAERQRDGETDRQRHR